MKEPNWSSCSEEELWEYVSYHLSLHGFNTVLVGGAVVSIYSKGIYKSGDLDLVLENYQVNKKEFESTGALENVHCKLQIDFYR